ncbi:prolyl oligopeptidase family serine peptidase [Novosphingobium sp.]|jgi:prolyl oligopeptidase|uniref:prolyl oligopeptidase family serine peptidase n=1 Tax=Novosphingobium sp. TaxID=1874826 RepID=UPI0022CD1D7F|nr:prolyl oligopeptidase family serine peptidase [Novosphingobium sp.]MCZ8019559.1 prolyl oligopeptidase family serine peptidase [Novosphingobium sp.]MCZ8035374.1 prolyl oligopeptidase family serine peptidase [Novosphingobium sp.]MCZ8050688.1 prolyl oligopeptidase family serine peptidase [Novosphingobium sp.]MCZ8059034.1 prolyl oligopeptidase family serine peptidase [Novosphingobium sp.]MCZ8232480.1 prolyl oligopeptidase family serine peptidase [Novosphingobium sp.]
MSRRVPAILAAALLSTVAAPLIAEKMTLAYPDTRQTDLVEEQFGEKVADPYRWLENDVRTDSEVAGWVARQNAVTQQYLAKLPQRDWFAQRIRGLLDYERFGLPRKAGQYYFYMRNSGLQNQSQLFVRKGLNGTPRLLIDPNAWAKDGATALDAWVPSDNGKLLAYSIQDGGSDWRTIKVLDTTTGKDLGDGVKWAKFTGIAWVGNEGFLYSRFPEPKPGDEFQSLNKNQAIYFHRIGTSQAEDQMVYSTPNDPDLGHSAEVTHDNRWVVITTAKGTDSRYAIHVMPLGKDRKWQAQTLIGGLDHAWNLIEGIGDTLYFVTNKDAPKMKVVKFDLRKKTALYRTECESPAKPDDVCMEPRPEPVDVIPERAETLDRAQIVGNRLVLAYLKDAKSVAEVRSLDGKPVQQITLNAIGTASGFTGRPGDPETFYAFSSFNQPTGIFRFDASTGKSTPFALPKLTFNPADYAIEQRFYTSKDGTRVPMFVVRKKAVADARKAVPTLLYGYGGFDIALTPGFSAVRMAWLEAGGAFALANLRGGGEYGKAWHDAGRLGNKQNVFDDFIAAGEFLIAEGITPKGGLSIQGGSNGGLLVGAVVNQRPDLFVAANPAVGVMDMLRFDRFTAGRYWVDDYGYPSNEGDWRVLRSYSPYHNIKVGVDYPAVLVTTADTDDRVVPGHSFKYTAALQAAKAGSKPHLIRIETRAGHGSGKPTDKVVAENADVLAFLAQWSGLSVQKSE